MDQKSKVWSLKKYGQSVTPYFYYFYIPLSEMKHHVSVALLETNQREYYSQQIF